MINNSEIVILVLSASMHILTDILFSNFYLFWPINETSQVTYGWNSKEHLISEIIMGILFFLIFILSGDYKKFNQVLKKSYILQDVNKNDVDLRNKIIKLSYFIYFMFCVFQYLIYIYFLIFFYVDQMWIYIILLILFTLNIVVLLPKNKNYIEIEN